MFKKKGERMKSDVFLMVWMCTNNPFMICNKSSKFILYETRNFLIYLLIWWGGGAKACHYHCDLLSPRGSNFWKLDIFQKCLTFKVVFTHAFVWMFEQYWMMCVQTLKKTFCAEVSVCESCCYKHTCNIRGSSFLAQRSWRRVAKEECLLKGARCTKLAKCV